MGENSNIEWTDHTFNPWRGCVEVHAGCDHCYAREWSKRNPAALGQWGDGAGENGGVRVVAAESYWRGPRKWNRDAEAAGVRARVFCASMADVFEDWQGPMVNAKGDRLYVCTEGEYTGNIGDFPSGRLATMNDVRQRLFALIDATPWLDWILVTKRPENILRMWPMTPGIPSTCVKAGGEFAYDRVTQLMYRPNVWLLTSVSDQATADEQIPELLRCSDLTPVLGISAEPLLGPIDVSRWLLSSDGFAYGGDDVGPIHWSDGGAGLGWVIAGGESGHGARPMHPSWVASLRNQCAELGTPFFFKQWGEWQPSFHFQTQFAHVPDATPVIYLADDGSTADNAAALEGKSRVGLCVRVGKKRAGRTLFEETYSEFPAARADYPTPREIEEAYHTGDGA